MLCVMPARLYLTELVVAAAQSLADSARPLRRGGRRPDLGAAGAVCRRRSGRLLRFRRCGRHAVAPHGSGCAGS